LSPRIECGIIKNTKPIIRQSKDEDKRKSFAAGNRLSFKNIIEPREVFSTLPVISGKAFWADLMINEIRNESADTTPLNSAEFCGMLPSLSFRLLTIFPMTCSFFSAETNVTSKNGSNVIRYRLYS
jgi:hypothetical protein